MGRIRCSLFSRARRGLVVAAVLFAAVGCGGGGASGERPTLRVMTQNLYYGAEFDGVVAALASPVPDPLSILLAGTAVWAEIRANSSSVRAGALADQIAAGRPDLVGLQEAAVFRTQFPSDEGTSSPTPATVVALDFAQMVIDALAARGHHYEVVASVETFSVELPVATDDGVDVQDLRITDREVLLARADLLQDGVHLYRLRSGVYRDGVGLPGPSGVTLWNGWVSADVWIGGRIVRVVSTHLASDDEEVQRAQAAEALNTLFDGSLEVVFMGDFNSDALRRPGPDLTQTYFDVLAVGYDDAWSLAHPGVPGATWGRPGGLAGPAVGTALTERIDLVFFAGADIVLEGVDLLGEDPADRRGGLWPSDHAGVLASFEIH